MLPTNTPFALNPAAPGAWGVFSLFLVPIGGGIPAGVLLARARHIAWPVTMTLYFITDVILACTFEPILRLLMRMGRHLRLVQALADAVRLIARRATAPYGTKAGPLALVMVAFGVDPMSGRAAAAAAGHGFLSGWAIAITGDMLYFSLIMISTLYLNSFLGNGTLTTLLIMGAMFVGPSLWKKLRGRNTVTPQNTTSTHTSSRP